MKTLGFIFFITVLIMIIQDKLGEARSSELEKK
jgi:hypothetical protein